MCFGVEEIYRQDLAEDGGDVHDEVFPACVVHADWIHEVCEEGGGASEELLDGYAAGAFGVGKEFHEVCYMSSLASTSHFSQPKTKREGGRRRTISQSIIPNVIRQRIQVYEKQHRDTSPFIRRFIRHSFHGFGHRDCPADVDGEHAEGAGEEHDAAGVAGCDEGNEGSVYETPAGLVLLARANDQV